MEKVLLVWEQLRVQQRAALMFLQPYPVLIAELMDLMRLIKALSKELKNQGITQQSDQRVRDIFGNQADKPTNIRALEQNMLAYLAEKRGALPQEGVIYCCSDVTVGRCH